MGSGNSLDDLPADVLEERVMKRVDGLLRRLDLDARARVMNYLTGKYMSLSSAAKAQKDDPEPGLELD